MYEWHVCSDSVMKINWLQLGLSVLAGTESRKHSFFSGNRLQSNYLFATQDSAFFYRDMKVSFLLLKLTLT